jgi:Family of unknown function (DUF6994)
MSRYRPASALGVAARQNAVTYSRVVTVIDTTFDFRSDTPPGLDPDTYSPTLRRYHQLLWSKPLPGGVPFVLDITTPRYLHHLSELGEFWLSSDTVIPSFSRWLRMAHLIDQIPEVEREEFNRIGYTIGGMMIFPANQVDRKPTINGARGLHALIADRFDLTVECIRRHYLDEQRPEECADALEKSKNLVRSRQSHVRVSE